VKLQEPEPCSHKLKHQVPQIKKLVKAKTAFNTTVTTIAIATTATAAAARCLTAAHILASPAAPPWADESRPDAQTSEKGVVV